MENMIDVYIKMEGDGKIPQYASKHAAGCDLYATEDMVIRPGETKIMPLNFNMAMDAGMEAQIRPRSGLSLKTQLRLPNAPGTIDSDYRDMVGVILQNNYNIANLPCQIAQKPELLEILRKDYREIELAEYLSAHNGSKPVFGQMHASATVQAPAEVQPSAAIQAPENIQAAVSELSVLRQKIIIDKNDNPYGSIYINKGERIAQMVFCEFRKANFILHDDPREIGEDRGGGFGHTGKG
jgi:dUTP pyrophosphatase